MHVIETEPLKRCPFCGGEAILSKNESPYSTRLTYQVFCPKCHATGEKVVDGSTGTGLNHTFITPEEAAGKAAEAWNRRTGPDITELQDDIYELSIVTEKVEAIADELQQEYFGEAEPESSMLNANYDRGRILSNIVFDYAHRAKEITEALEGKV